MPDGSAAPCRGAAPPDLMAESDRVVLRRLTARPKPRRTTLVFGVSQMILGLAIVAISFTAFGLSSSNRVRNACPYWAGFSVLLTGGVGLIAWKQPSSLALSFFTFLSAVCVVLHLVATALSGLSGADLQTMTSCRDDVRPRTCHCCELRARCVRVDDMVAFEGVRDCTTITSTMKDLMYSVCVTNIVACVICIAATIIGCAYIVKRHTTRRMIVRRSQCSNLARDSFFSNIIMPTDSIFTPPVAPPPPYSPPDYTAISNDRVLVESNEFMDDISTPTPVIGPQDMPPPYSTLDLSPGGTIECAVAQEYQMDPTEIHRIEHSCLSSQTVVRNSYNPGRAIITVCRRTNSEQIPTPPLRWDSHHVGRINPLTRMEQPGSNTVVEPHQHHRHHTSNLSAPVHGIDSNIRRTKSKSRPRSGDSPRVSPQHAQHARQSLPPVIHRNGGERNGNYIIVEDGMAVQPRIRTNSGGCLPVVIMRPHRSRPPQGIRVSTASQTSLEETDNTATSGNIISNAESINVGDRVIPSIPCSVSCEAVSRQSHRSAQFHNANERTKAGYDNFVPTVNNPYGAEQKSGSSLMDRKPSSSSGSVSEPPNSVPSQNKSSSSNERLTTSTNSSRTSRDSASAAGRKHRRRHSHHAVDRRRVSSSTTCSTSPTDASSRSSGSFSRNRRRSRNRYISTSSSSDSENDQRYPVPRRVIVARMANGAVKHDMLDPKNVCGYAGADHHEHRLRKSSGSSSNTPPRGRPKHPKTGGERARSGNRKTSSSGPPTRPDTKMLQNIPKVTADPSMSVEMAPDSSEKTNLRQKRPNSLNLRLGRKSHPAAQPRQGQQVTVKFAESNDPWVHRDTGKSYASVGVQSMPEQSPTIQAASKKLKDLNKLPSTTNPPQTIASAPTPSTNVDDPSSVPKPKLRPKSMVELSQDTSVIVSSFLRQSVHGLSPAIKTVLEDIQSVITTDEQYLAEVMKSQSIVDEFMEKSSSREKIPESKKTTDPKLPRTETSPSDVSPLKSKEPLEKSQYEKSRTEDISVLPTAKTKIHHCLDSEQDALLQECLVKTLKSARETVL